MDKKIQIKTIVVDDEELALSGLVMMLETFPEINIAATCSNGVEAIKEIHERQPDVVFLDVNMPYLNGFEVLELLGDESPLVVFVTAYDEYAVKAFEANAVDYLLKPVNPERLKQTVERLLNKDTISQKAQQQLIRKQQRSRMNIDRILVRDNNTVHVIAAADILWIEAQDDYVAIKTRDEVYLKLERLTNLENQLDEQHFKRIHRSYIVNADYLVRIENQKWAVLKNGTKLPVSRSGYARFFA